MVHRLCTAARGRLREQGSVGKAPQARLRMHHEVEVELEQMDGKALPWHGCPYTASAVSGGSPFPIRPFSDRSQTVALTSTSARQAPANAFGCTHRLRIDPLQIYRLQTRYRVFPSGS